MKLFNNSKFVLVHGKYKLGIGKVLDVPKNVAELWQKFEGVTLWAEPKDVKAAEEKAAKEKQALKDENAKLKAELEALKKTAKDVKAADK